MSAPKLSLDGILSLIEKEDYHTQDTLTICVLTLGNGAMVTGQSNVIDPANFNADLGREIARRNTIDKIWELEGYACKTRGFPET